MRDVVSDSGSDSGTHFLPTFLINLDRSTDRLTRMQAEFARVGMDFERFCAVDGLNLPDDRKPYFCDAEGVLVSRLTPGEIGCYASHIGVWKRIVAMGVPAALVCEDDAMLPDDMVDVVAELLAVLPTGWDMVHLSRSPDRAFKPLEPLANGRSLIRHSRVPAGTAAYLISREGATKMLAPGTPRRWAVDHDTRWPWLFRMDVYGVNPPPVRLRNDQSVIRASGRARLRAGLRRSPFRTPASFLFNLRQLGPYWWTRCFVANCGVKLRNLLRPVRRRVSRSSLLSLHGRAG
jgi:glycosyl transferase, family 25